MNIYLLNILYLITLTIVIIIFNRLYGWNFLMFPNYLYVYAIVYFAVFVIPFVYNAYKYDKTKNDPKYDRQITESKWLAVLFIVIFIITFNALIYKKLGV